MTVLLKPSLSSVATDPLRNFKFMVHILNPNLPGFAGMGFMSAAGFGITTEVIPYREGGMNTTTQKMPGQSDFSPLTFSKGLAVGNGEMWKWMKQLFAVMEGSGTGSPGENFRFNADVKILDHPVTDRMHVKTKAWFRAFNTWPTSLSFSDFDAGANAIVVQQMTLAHEGFDFDVAPNKNADLSKPPGS